MLVDVLASVMFVSVLSYSRQLIARVYSAFDRTLNSWRRWTGQVHNAAELYDCDRPTMRQCLQ